MLGLLSGQVVWAYGERKVRKGQNCGKNMLPGEINMRDALQRVG